MTSLNVRENLAGYRAEFLELAAHQPVAALALEIHSDSLTPVGAFDQFVGDDVGFLLESVEDGQRYGRFSFLGRRPLGSLSSTNGEVVSTGLFNSVDKEHGSLYATDNLLQHLSKSAPVGDYSPDIPLRGGVVGAVGWEVIREIEKLNAAKPRDVTQPDCSLVVVGDLVVFDHWRQSLTLIANVESGSEMAPEDVYEVALEAIDDMLTDLGRTTAPTFRPARSSHSMPIAPFTRTVDSSTYQNLVRCAKEFIEQGDIFQIVLSQRFDVGEVEDPFAVYRVLRQMNPSAYLYYLQLPDCTVVGSSPEALVRMRNKRVTTRPIAGSRPVSDSEVENALRAATLREDPKEIAEHVMLVDLGRNDIGRISSYGSVVVEELMQVEYYSHIMHLTSQVSGEVREDVSSVDALRATFPAGTLSGAPKVRAMELIGELEPQSRGLYGGAVGYFDTSGNFDAAILIRTLVVDSEGNGSVQTGAGIVWDSDPRTEDEECLSKAEAVLRAVGGARSAP